ncbi:MAG: TIM barrel protein [Planctomycetota bacterium]
MLNPLRPAGRVFEAARVFALALALLPAPAVAAVSAAAAAAPALMQADAADPQQDPEESPFGRERFLGREVAHTMHWAGAGWLLRATREKEENGVLLRRWLNVQGGQGVCDLGCGNGYHTLPMARAVGPDGDVFAVDLQPQMLQLLEMRMDEQNIDNVVCIEATVDDPKLPQRSCDLVLLVDVYHELSHPVRVMRRVRESLRPNGRVVLVEFREEDPAVPIKPEHKMSKAQVVREMAALGFAFASECDDLPWQHAMAFVAAEDPGPRFEAEELLRGFLRAAASARSAGEKRVAAGYVAAARTTAARTTAARTTAASAAPDNRLTAWLASSRDGQDSGIAATDRFELRAGPSGTLSVELRRGAGDRGKHPLADRLALACDDVGRWHVVLRTPGKEATPRRPAFVALHNATGKGTLDERVARAASMGFDGVAWTDTGLGRIRTACEERDLDVRSAYLVVDLGGDRAQALQRAQVAMDKLADGPGMLWVGLQNKSHAPRSPDGDKEAASWLRELLKNAMKTGVEIALYPHHGFWLETTEHALALCEQVDAESAQRASNADLSIGVCFNLCHYLRAHEESDPRSLLRRCGKRLLAVTICGADRDGGDWDTLIQPLGRGDFDTSMLLRQLEEMNFDGPVGLQAYGIRLPAEQHVRASVAAWRDMWADALRKETAGQGR